MTIKNKDGTLRCQGYVINGNRKREPEEPSEERKRQGRLRRKLEESLRDKQLDNELKEVWE